MGIPGRRLGAAGRRTMMAASFADTRWSSVSDSPGFVHLSVHTEYSLVDSVVRVKSLVKAAAARGMPAVAMTDHMNLFAAVKFVSAAESEGVKPILG